MRRIALGLALAAPILGVLASVLWMMHHAGGSYGGTP